MNNNLIIDNYSQHYDLINNNFGSVDNIIEKIMDSKARIHYYGNRYNIYIPNKINDNSDKKLIIGYILIIENGCYNPESWIRKITCSVDEIFYV